jgi:hypothetical protein
MRRGSQKSDPVVEHLLKALAIGAAVFYRVLLAGGLDENYVSTADAKVYQSRN